MPLFFFISGYFFNEKYSARPLLLIRKRIKSLYWPFLYYALIFALLHNFFLYLNIYNINTPYHGITTTQFTIQRFLKELYYIATFRTTEQLFGAYWFLFVLFFVNVAFTLMRYSFVKLKIQNESYFILFVILLFISGNLLTYFHITLPYFYGYLNVVFVAVLIFYMGFRYRMIESMIPYKALYAAICLTLLAFNTYYGTIDMSSNAYINPPFLIINTLLGVYLNIYVARKLLKYNSKLLEYIGNKTIHILALHFLSFKLISFIIVSVYNYPDRYLALFPIVTGNGGWWIAYSAAGVFLPISMMFIIDKIKNLLSAVYSYQRQKSIA